VETTDWRTKADLPDDFRRGTFERNDPQDGRPWKTDALAEERSKELPSGPRLGSDGFHHTGQSPRKSTQIGAECVPPEKKFKTVTGVGGKKRTGSMTGHCTALSEEAGTGNVKVNSLKQI
jgi:hypothetical protein